MALSNPIRSVRHAARPKPKKPLGAGDAVALVAQPIAKAIDSLGLTKLADCQTCGGRQDSLNAAIPDIKTVPGQLIGFVTGLFTK